MIERWLAAVERGARDDAALGHEMRRCGRLIKGYGATNERGKQNLLHVIDHLTSPERFATPASVPRRSPPHGARRWPTTPARRSTRPCCATVRRRGRCASSRSAGSRQRPGGRARAGRPHHDAAA